MTFEIGQLTIAPAAPAPVAPARVPEAAPVEQTGPALDTSDVIPASPPPEVLAEVDAAWERADALAAQNRELHFARDASTGRLVIEVRTLDGEVVKTIPPSEALNVMSGGTL
jgi:flagellar protein FlaG